MDVAVIGGKNSAAIAALELWRSGARVTLIYRGPGMHATREVLDQAGHRKPHQGRRDQGLLFDRRLWRSRPTRWWWILPRAARRCANDFVFAMTGYHPDFTFLEAAGSAIRGQGPVAGLQSGDARKQRSRHLSGRSDCGRLAHQRDLHRERTLSRKADRGVAGFENKAARRSTRFGCRSQFDRLGSVLSLRE